MKHPYRIILTAILLFACQNSCSALDLRIGEVISSKSPTHGKDFSYYIPKSFQQHRTGLVISYHGAGGRGAGEIKAWVPLAEEFGFVVACPTARLAGAGVKAGTPMKSDEASFIQEAESTVSIVQTLIARCKIDKRRVMVTGFSGGGNPSYWLGLFESEHFPFVCTRCGNFPTIISRLYASDAKRKDKADKAAADHEFFVFWGERDHPIILQSIGKTLAFLKTLNIQHYQEEKVPGMGHKSNPRKAAEWFVQRLALKIKAWRALDQERYQTALQTAAEKLKQNEHSAAAQDYAQALSLEQEYGFGKDAAKALKKIDKVASKQLLSVKKLIRSKDPEAASKLEALIRDFPSTKTAEKAQKELLKLQKH